MGGIVCSLIDVDQAVVTLQFDKFCEFGGESLGKYMRDVDFLARKSICLLASFFFLV